MDVDAPNFRAGTLIGVVIGQLAAVVAHGREHVDEAPQAPGQAAQGRAR